MQPWLCRERGEKNTKNDFTGHRSDNTWHKEGQSIWYNGLELSLHLYILPRQTDPIIAVVISLQSLVHPIFHKYTPSSRLWNILVMKALALKKLPGQCGGENVKTVENGRVTNAINSDGEGGLPRKAS